MELCQRMNLRPEDLYDGCSSTRQGVCSLAVIVMTSAGKSPAASEVSQRNHALQQHLSLDTSSQVSPPVGHCQALETAVFPRGP